MASPRLKETALDRGEDDIINLTDQCIEHWNKAIMEHSGHDAAVAKNFHEMEKQCHRGLQDATDALNELAALHRKVENALDEDKQAFPSLHLL